LVLFV
jgi:hypothetical protein